MRDSPTRRPVFLQPLKIALPVMATVSFAHRVSGILIALALPWLLQLLALSLGDEAGYFRVFTALQSPPVRVSTVVLVWALAHHAAAGVRHMLFDLGIGVSLPAARRSAWAVHGIALAAALWTALAMSGGRS